MSINSVQGDLIRKLLPAFCKSAEQTFETMVFMKLSCGESQPKVDGSPSGAISGTIGLTGEGVLGSLSLIFPRPLVEKVLRSMMMMEDDEELDPAGLKDVVGELTNMAAGGAKAALQDEGINFTIGLPTVVVGEAHHLESPVDAKTHVVAMSTDHGVFHMELTVS